jgi:DNA-binding response OmpR family regulator
MGVTKRRLLIVDDEPEIRSTMTAYFSEIGYEVDAAPDGIGALAELTRGYDGVLSDIKMPGCGGIEFLRQVRRVNPRLTIFFITGYPSLETIVDAKTLGAAAYFLKPLDLKIVASRLRAHFDATASDRLPAPADPTDHPAGAA